MSTKSKEFTIGAIQVDGDDILPIVTTISAPTLESALKKFFSKNKDGRVKICSVFAGSCACLIGNNEPIEVNDDLDGWGQNSLKD